MLMGCFDDKGKYITSAYIVCEFKPAGKRNTVLGYVISKKGKPSQFFGTSVSVLLKEQQELGFRIINRSGQCLSFLGEDT
jgi:hypothetical protein